MWKPTLEPEPQDSETFIEFKMSPFEIKWDELRYQPSRPVEVKDAQTG